MFLLSLNCCAQLCFSRPLQDTRWGSRMHSEQRPTSKLVLEEQSYPSPGFYTALLCELGPVTLLLSIGFSFTMRNVIPFSWSHQVVK